MFLSADYSPEKTSRNWVQFFSPQFVLLSLCLALLIESCNSRRASFLFKAEEVFLSHCFSISSDGPPFESVSPCMAISQIIFWPSKERICRQVFRRSGVSKADCWCPIQAVVRSIQSGSMPKKIKPQPLVFDKYAVLFSVVYILRLWGVGHWVCQWSSKGMLRASLKQPRGSGYLCSCISAET